MFTLSHGLLVLATVQLASASLWITFPVKGSVCAVSKPCQVKWQDSPDSPSTSTLGETSVDLVDGEASNLQLAQHLGGVTDPSLATAFTFTPDASLSRNVQYAIRFTPKNNPSGLIFSTYFNITGGPNTPVTNASVAAPSSKVANVSSINPIKANTSTVSLAPSRNVTVATSSNTPNVTSASAPSKSSSCSLFMSISPLLIVSMASIAYMAL